MKNINSHDSVRVTSLGCNSLSTAHNGTRTPPLSRVFALLAIAVSSTLTPIAGKASSEVERLTQGLTERVEFNVNEYEVIGSNPLSAVATNAILADYLGPNRGIDDIESAANALEAAMVAKG